MYLKEDGRFSQKEDERNGSSPRWKSWLPILNCGLLRKVRWKALRRLQTSGYSDFMLCAESSSRLFC